MIDAPFPELVIGQKKTSRGRTMTETDVVNFCMLTGNWLELHSNIEFARHTLYGQRLVQGSMVFSIVNAMIPFDPEGCQHAHDQADRIEERRCHQSPVVAGQLEHVHPGDRHEVEPEMAHHHAFRLARCTRGVEHHGNVVGQSAHHIRHRLAGLERVQGSGAFVGGATGEHYVVQGWNLAPRRENCVEDRRLAYDRASLAVIEQIGELVALEHHVDRDRDRSHPQNRKIGDHHIRMIVHHEGDPVAWLYSQTDETSGQLGHSAFKSRVVEIAPFAQQGSAVRKPSRRRCQNLVADIHGVCPK
jgi:hypothetical protein